ncbi:hypothetical protein B0T17DRAFT_109927, partial [Bombardia bombarda]
KRLKTPPPSNRSTAIPIPLNFTHPLYHFILTPLQNLRDLKPPPPLPCPHHPPLPFPILRPPPEPFQNHLPLPQRRKPQTDLHLLPTLPINHHPRRPSLPTLPLRRPAIPYMLLGIQPHPRPHLHPSLLLLLPLLLLHPHLKRNLHLLHPSTVDRALALANLPPYSCGCEARLLAQLTRRAIEDGRVVPLAPAAGYLPEQGAESRSARWISSTRSSAGSVPMYEKTRAPTAMNCTLSERRAETTSSMLML